MTTAWSYLPNAKYIDLVLISIKKYPEKWGKASFTVGKDIRANARSVVYNLCWNTERMTVWKILWDEIITRVSNQYGYNLSVIREVFMALIAYDDCAHLLYSDPKEVKLLAKLGVPAAILLLPACIIFNETKEI